ncbi:MAG: L-glyceraldehyde 3-phosphate reductase [Lentisphaerae bacterium]|nr:L-glyceraldehyde 3-phosphate reductase [Lentisphaerota bacterium]
MPFTADANRYSNMTYRKCGKSGLKLPAISLGLWQNFGGERPYEISRSITRAAFDLGITHFDLANNYGPPPGSAEETFGKIMRDDFFPYRDEMIISTKAGYYMWPGPYGDRGSRKYLLASLDQSLQRMDIDYVDIFYSHRPDPETPLEETMGALATAVKSGKALYAGISSYPPDTTREAARILESMGTPCLIHQPAYSMLNRTIEEGLLEATDETGMGVIAFCPLAQGLLTPRFASGKIPEDSRVARNEGLRKQLTPELLTKLAELDSFAKKRGQSLPQLALAWILRDERITSALIGASSVEQVVENAAAASTTPLAEDEIEAIEKILSD